MTEQELEKEIKKVYARASKEMTEKMKAYLKQFEEEIDLMSQKVEAGEITERYFNKWKRDKIMQYNQWYDTRNKITDVLMDADDVARDLIKGALPTVMADGINRTFYELEQVHEIGDMGISFKLTDENTVKRLLTEHPRLLPVLDEESETARMIREGKAIRWNQQHITSEITQGIIQGESMPKIAERMMNVTGMNYRSAIRNARTATGGAYNAGRIEGMKQAEEKGVKMLKRWSAIFDDKTRDEHRLLDGVTIPIDEKFEIDGYELEYPRDPNGEPEMIYNCRCRLVSVPALIADTYDEIFDKDGQTTQSGLTYDEWKEGKKAEQETTTETETRSSESASAALTTETEKQPENDTPSEPVQVEFGNADAVLKNTGTFEQSQAYSERMSSDDIDIFNDIFKNAEFKESSNGTCYDPIDNHINMDANSASEGWSVFHESTHWKDYNANYTITDNWGGYKYVPIDDDGNVERRWVDKIVTIQENAGFSEYVSWNWSTTRDENGESLSEKDMKNIVSILGMSDTYGNNRSPENVKQDVNAISDYMKNKGISSFDPDYGHISDFVSAMTYDATLGSLTTGGHSYDYWTRGDTNRVTEIVAGYNLLRATGRTDLLDIERELAPNLLQMIEKEWFNVWKK